MSKPVRWESTARELKAVKMSHLHTYDLFTGYCEGQVRHSQGAWLRKRGRLGFRAIQKKDYQRVPYSFTSTSSSIPIIVTQYTSEGKEIEESDRPQLSVTPRTLIELPEPIEVDPNCMILADMHIPNVNYGWLKTAMECAEIAGVDTIIHAGDLLDMAQFFKPDLSSVSIKEEMDTAREITSWIDKLGFRQVYLPGNHEARLNRITNGQIGMWVFEDYFQNTCEITELAWVEIDGFGRVCHPGNYSKIQLSVPAELSARHECGIIGTHSHHAATGWSRSGKHQILEAGIMADVRRAYYKTRVMVRSSEWQNGCVIVKEDYAHLLHPQMPCFEIAKAIA